MKKSLVIFLPLLILFFITVWLKTVQISDDMVQYTLLFPKIGGLKVGDPVSVNGLEKGIVSAVYLHEAEVAVRIKIDGDISFTDSSSAEVTTLGLLGERQVAITLSPLGTLYRPDGDTVSNYIRGGYQLGLSEAIGKSGNILSRVDTIINSIDKLPNISPQNSRSGDSNRVEITLSVNGEQFSAKAAHEDLGEALTAVSEEISRQLKKLEDN